MDEGTLPISAPQKFTLVPKKTTTGNKLVHGMGKSTPVAVGTSFTIGDRLAQARFSRTFLRLFQLVHRFGPVERVSGSLFLLFLVARDTHFKYQRLDGILLFSHRNLNPSVFGCLDRFILFNLLLRIRRMLQTHCGCEHPPNHLFLPLLVFLFFFLFFFDVSFPTVFLVLLGRLRGLLLGGLRKKSGTGHFFCLLLCLADPPSFRSAGFNNIRVHNSVRLTLATSITPMSKGKPVDSPLLPFLLRCQSFLLRLFG